MSENISFFLSEIEENSNTKIDEIEDISFVHNTLEYNMYSISELMKICDYYSLTKNVKMAKYKKKDLIYSIEIYENNIENYFTVLRRKKYWFYMNELIKDNYMKKYIYWK
jgi:hypothetical protein